MFELNICIPTFNRKEKVLSLLNYLRTEFHGRSYCITVRDNCSEDGTFCELQSVYGECDNVFIKKNERNIGLGGNLAALYKENISTFIWVIGDDDHLESGIADYLFGSLAKSDAGCYLLNHQAINKKNQVLFLNAYQCSEEFSDSLLPIFHDKGSVMMFITSVVYRVSAINELVSKKPSNISARLTLPLYMSLGVAELRGVQFLQSNSFLKNIHGDISWSKDAWKVFLIGIPSELLRMFILTGKTYCLLLGVRYLMKRSAAKFLRSVIGRYEETTK